MRSFGPHQAAVAATSEAARAGRSERDRRLLADPAAAVEATRAVLAAGSEAAQGYFRLGFEVAYGAYNRGDWEVNTLFMDSAYVFRPAAGEGFIDAKSEYRGVAEYIEAQEAMLDVWSDVQIELTSVVVGGSDQVVSVTAWRGTAAGSGLEMRWDAVSDNRFRDGVAVSQTFWFNRRRAESDLGISLAPA